MLAVLLVLLGAATVFPCGSSSSSILKRADVAATNTFASRMRYLASKTHRFTHLRATAADGLEATIAEAEALTG